MNLLPRLAVRFGRLAFVSCLALTTSVSVPAAGKPNAIFILADDLGCGDLGCFGQTKPDEARRLFHGRHWQMGPRFSRLRQHSGEFAKLTLDDAGTTPTLVPRGKANRPLYENHCHFFALPELAPGEHTARAIVRELAAGKEHSRTITFSTQP